MYTLSLGSACVEKYLLEKTRIVRQAGNERNYHVFYYLLAGASAPERETWHLTKPEDYFYLSQVRRAKKQRSINPYIAEKNYEKNFMKKLWKSS